MPVWLQILLAVVSVVTGITGPWTVYLCVWSITHHRQGSGPMFPFRRRDR